MLLDFAIRVQQSILIMKCSEADVMETSAPKKTMIMSTDMKTDTRTGGECAAGTPVCKLCQEGIKNRRSGEREGWGWGLGGVGAVGCEECTDEISAVLNLRFSYFTVTSH